MLKNIIILITLLLCTNKLFSQQKPDSVLLDLERQFYYSTNDTLKAELLLKKTHIYLNTQLNDSILLTEMERLNWELISDSNHRANHLWNASVLNFLHNKHYRALNYLTKYKENNYSDTSVNCKLLEALILMNIDSAKLYTFLNDIHTSDTLLQNVRCYISTINYAKKGKALYQTSSAIIPGMGMFALGKPKQAITSIILNSGTAYAIYALLQNNLYFNAITWGMVLVQKFYLGGIRLTGKLFEEKEAKNKSKLSNLCENNIKVLLLKYPIDYKYK